jgi:hypothetical protein
MARVFLYLILIYFGADINGQTINPDSIFEPRLSGEMFHIRTGVRGKQFYNDDWAASNIKLSTGEWVFNKKLKYNGLMDEIIWLQTDSFRQIKLEKHFIDEFYFKDYSGKLVRFKRIRIKLSQLIDSSDIFVEVLAENKALLYVFRNIKIEGTDNVIEGGELYSYDLLVPRPLYILNLPDGETVYFRKIRRRILLNTLNDNYKTIFRDIIQHNHLIMRTEDDLTKLTNLLK